MPSQLHHHHHHQGVYPGQGHDVGETTQSREPFYVNIDPHEQPQQSTIFQDGQDRTLNGHEQRDNSDGGHPTEELLQAVKEPTSSRETLHYKIGDIITVLDKMPTSDAILPDDDNNDDYGLRQVLNGHSNSSVNGGNSAQGLWKGRLSSGDIGLFDPSNTAIFLGHTLPTPAPSITMQPASAAILTRQNSATSSTSSSNGHHHHRPITRRLSTNSNSCHPSTGHSGLHAMMTSSLSNGSSNGHSSSSSSFNHKFNLKGIIDVISSGAQGIYQQSKKSRLKRDMISMPQSDFKHTGHVGVDGTFFGDVSHILGGSEEQHPAQKVTTTFGTSEVSAPPAAKSRLSKAKISLPMPVVNLNLKKKVRPSSAQPSSQDSHMYHEIGRHQMVDPPPALESPAFEAIDFGPSLMDEVFRELDLTMDEQVANDSLSNVKNDIKEMVGHHRQPNRQTSTASSSLNASGRKSKVNQVKTISAEEEHTLDSAIAMAKELATRSILDMDGLTTTDNENSPKTPTSPNKKSGTTKFTFPNIMKGGKSGERRTFSEEAEKIPDIESTLTSEAKEAYYKLVEVKKPTNPVPVPVRSSSIPKDELGDYQQQMVAATHQTPSPDDPNPLRMLRSGQAPTAFTKRSSCRGLTRGHSVPSRSSLGTPPPVPTPTTSANPDNLLPLPPKSVTTSMAMKAPLKHHQRKHPLLIPITKGDPDNQDVPDGSVGPCQLSTFRPYNLPPLLKQVSCPEPPSNYRPLSGLHQPTYVNHPHVSHGKPVLLPQPPPLPTVTNPQPEPSFEEEVQSAIQQLKMTDIKRSVDELLETKPPPPAPSTTPTTPKGASINQLSLLFPGKGVTSDEVRVMQKVLQKEVTLDAEECVDLLNQTDWDVHRAIKAVRLREALQTHRVTLSDVDWIGTLRKFNWNVRQASNYLLATQGTSSEV